MHQGFPAGAMEPRTTDGAEYLAAEYGTNDLDFDQWAFDSATEEAVFLLVYLYKWDGGTIKCRPEWTAAAGSGTSVFGFSARRYTNDDAIDQAMGTEQTSTDTLIATGDWHTGPETAAITVAGSGGNWVLIRIAGKTSGSIANDRLLKAIDIEWSINETAEAAW